MKTIKIATVLGAISVGVGAFGAHGLKPYLIEIGRLDTFETAVRYQFYHTLALLLIGILQLKFDNRSMNFAASLMLIGIIIFSGSLYLLCLTQLSGLGAITPIGGIALIAGWIMLFLGIKKA